MRYMLMLYADEKAGNAIPKADMDKWMDKMYAYQATLEKAGVHVENAGLAPTWEATTVNLADGELKVHDGPYAEAKEQLGGFYIIDVPDMATAQHWAGQCPAAIWGHIEIRPYSHYERG